MVNTAHLPSRETSGAPRRCIDCMSVAVMGRAESGEAANAAAAAARRSEARGISRAYKRRPPAQAGLQLPPLNPGDLALYMLVHHLRQMLVEPLLEDRPEHLPD